MSLSSTDIVKEIYDLKSSGFDFVGNSIYNLKGHAYGEEITVSISSSPEESNSFIVAIKIGQIKENIKYKPGQSLSGRIFNEARKLVEINAFVEEGFSYKTLADGSIICTGKIDNRNIEVKIPPEFPKLHAIINVDGITFKFEADDTDKIITKFQKMEKTIELEKNKKILEKLGFKSIKSDMMEGFIEEERIRIKFPENFPSSPPIFTCGIIHPALTDKDGYIKIDYLRPIYWKKHPDIKKVIEEIRVKIERIHRNTERIYLEAYQLFKKTDLRPVSGSLDRWNGIILTDDGSSLNVEINIPKDFPMQPPEVYVLNVFPSEDIDSSRRVVHPIIKEWDERTHLVEIVETLKNFRRIELHGLDAKERLNYEHYYLQKYESSMTVLSQQELQSYRDSWGRNFFYGWKIAIDGEGILLGRKYIITALIDDNFPDTPPLIRFESELDVTERILLFGLLDSKTRTITIKKSGEEEKEIIWESKKTICEIIEQIKHKLKVEKYKIKTSEQFYEEIAELLVSDIIKEFKPVANNIYLWRGEYRVMSSAKLKKVYYEVRLSQNYPLSPPRVTIIEPMPFYNDNVEKDGVVKQSYLTQNLWRKNDLKDIVRKMRVLAPVHKKTIWEKLLFWRK